MAKQVGKIKIEGRTFGRLVFYKMNGEYYARTKSSLTGKRVKKDPRFQATMRSAGILARASKIGSAVYKALPKEFKQFWMYRSFTGEAMMMIKKGMTDAEAQNELFRIYVDVSKPVADTKFKKPQDPKPVKYSSAVFMPQALQSFLDKAANETLDVNHLVYQPLLFTG